MNINIALSVVVLIATDRKYYYTYVLDRIGSLLGVECRSINLS